MPLAGRGAKAQIGGKDQTFGWRGITLPLHVSA